MEIITKKSPVFTGFPRKMTQFFRELAQNNNRPWFERHKSEYEELVKKPAQDFLMAIETPLMSRRPYLNIDPRRSIFRIYRDVRFSKNKTPYKPWLSLAFWEGSGCKTENPGFFVRIAGNNILIGGGFHIFTKPVLAAFREEIISENGQKRFTKVVKNLYKKGFELSGEHYKRYPHDYSEDSPNSVFLRYNGLYIMQDLKIPREVYSAEFVDYCMERYSTWLELHEWLVDLSAGR